MDRVNGRAEREDDPLYDFLRTDDRGAIPQGFHLRIDPTTLANVIIGLEHPVKFHVRANDFCLALSEVKRVVPLAVWQNVLAKLAPYASVSVMGGPVWQPHVLIHGGLAIRNHHRVLALDLDSGTSQSGLDPRQIAADLAIVLKGAHDPIDDAHLIHHGQTGVEVFQNVPTPFQPVGQTLLFVNNRRLLRDLSVLGQWERWGGRSETHYQSLAFRIFSDTVCAYQLYRHTDQADFLLEDYSVAVLDLEAPGEPLRISECLQSSYSIDDAVAEQIDEVLQSCTPPDIAFDLRTAMLSIDNEWSWRNDVRDHLNVLPPLFAKEPRQVVSFETEDFKCVAAEAHQQKHLGAWAYYFSKSDTPIRDLARSVLGAKAAKAVIAEPNRSLRKYRFRRFSTSTPPDASLVYRDPWDKSAFGIRIAGLPEAHGIAHSVCRTTSMDVEMVIPHVGLHQHYSPSGRCRQGNARWFGLASRAANLRKR
ncbi:MAG TPA: hypothetical protein VE959_20410 [Bryobacteraceae bacterium]|nr:hypothetical protein [Bryobacteraceae bacterium]